MWWLGEGRIPVGVRPFCYIWGLLGSRFLVVSVGVTEGVAEAAFGLLPTGVANACDYGSFRP